MTATMDDVFDVSAGSDVAPQDDVVLLEGSGPVEGLSWWLIVERYPSWSSLVDVVFDSLDGVKTRVDDLAFGSEHAGEWLAFRLPPPAAAAEQTLVFTSADGGSGG